MNNKIINYIIIFCFLKRKKEKKMVKNTVGGKKGKMLANKNSGDMKREHIRLIQFPEMEVFVCVTKVFGGGIFEVTDNDGNLYKAFLRGKMKGHNKRHNLVSLFSILLVAKRIDTDPNKCDILFVYDSHDIQLLSLIPTLNLSHVLAIHFNQELKHYHHDLFHNIDHSYDNHTNNDNDNDNNNDNNDNNNDILDFSLI